MFSLNLKKIVVHLIPGAERDTVALYTKKTKFG